MVGLEELGHSREGSYGSTDMLNVNFLQYTWKNTFELKRLLLIILLDFFAQISYLDHYPCPRSCVFIFYESNMILTLELLLAYWLGYG